MAFRIERMMIYASRRYLFFSLFFIIHEAKLVCTSNIRDVSLILARNKSFKVSFDSTNSTITRILKRLSVIFLKKNPNRTNNSNDDIKSRQICDSNLLDRRLGLKTILDSNGK